jgi:hypothetical protein
MFQILSSASTYFFPSVQSLKLLTNGANITNSTNLLVVTKNITLTVVDCCAPPPIRLAFHCAGAAITIGASIAVPNPVTIGSTIHLLSEIYKNC